MAPKLALPLTRAKVPTIPSNFEHAKMNCTFLKYAHIAHSKICPGFCFATTLLNVQQLQ